MFEGVLRLEKAQTLLDPNDLELNKTNYFN